MDRHLWLNTELRLGSTDANLPLSLGDSGALHGRGRRGRRRAHAGGVVLGQGPRDGVETGAAADASDGASGPRNNRPLQIA